MRQAFPRWLNSQASAANSRAYRFHTQGFLDARENTLGYAAALEASLKIFYKRGAAMLQQEVRHHLEVEATLPATDVPFLQGYNKALNDTLRRLEGEPSE